jgi:hypothetical protein
MGVKLYTGIVLQVDENRRHLVEHSEEMQQFVKAVIAPGVFLLSHAERPAWERVLAEVGISPLPQTAPTDEDGASSAASSAEFPRIRVADVDRLESGERRVQEEEAPESELLDELQAALDGMQLPAELRRRVEARIADKLVLTPDQLRHAAGSAETEEARGFDYAGKVRLIEAALESSADLLEVVQRPHLDAPESILVRPLELEKHGSDLLLIGEAVPSRESVRIRVRKIGLIRKRRASVFGD